MVKSHHTLRLKLNSYESNLLQDNEHFFLQNGDVDLLLKNVEQKKCNRPKLLAIKLLVTKLLTIIDQRYIIPW